MDTPTQVRLWRTLLVLSALVLSPALLAQTGIIAGTVVEEGTGQTLPGVNVVIDGTTQGSSTSLDGDYRIASVAPGTYTLVFTYIGFTTKRVTGVEVAAGEVTTVDLALGEERLELGDGREVVVEARAIRNNEAALLRDRARAAAVSDAISAETISRAGASTAADAVQKVPGMTVVGGDRLVVRGLSDRYLSTQLNGATLPSADPERQSTPLDLFPSGLLDNIVASKSFTPDKPGTFTGGGVDISTRSFPEMLTAQISTSVGFNTAVEPGSDYLRYSNGGVGIFGVADDALALPALIQNASEDDLALGGSQFTNAFTNTFAAAPASVPLNTSFSASVGNQAKLFGRPFGFLFGTNWSKSADGYTGGINSEFGGTGDNLQEDYRLDTSFGEEEVLFGGLANLNYRLTDRDELGLNVIYNRNTNSQAIFQTGAFFDGTLEEEDNIYEGRGLFFKERSLFSSQLSGKHAITNDGLRVEWNGAYSLTTLSEPDFRIFQNEIDFSTSSGTPDYLIRTSAYSEPSRTYRDLEEDALNGALDVEIPLGERADRPVQLKVGVAGDFRTRTFRERAFNYPVRGRNQDLLSNFGGDIDAFIAQASENSIRVGEITDPDADYDGTMQVYAGYGMVDLALVEKLRFVGGVRVEYTDLLVQSPNGEFRGLIDPETGDRVVSGGYASDGLNDVLLPAASLVYAVTRDMNVRVAYGKTLARPSFREVAPRAVFDLAERYTINGNPLLVQSNIHNADLRWEWFTRPGEILAVSAFYKRFNDPIELTILAGNNQLRPENLADADLFGLEFEGRRQLTFLPGLLANLQAGGNLSVISAEVQLTDTEQLARGNRGETRPLEGQSPYVLNLDLGYLDAERGTSVNLFYNVFGRRLHAVSRGVEPDLYEDSRATLDFTASQDIWNGVSVKASAKNLLGEPYRLVNYDESTDAEFLRREYDLGRSFSLGVTYRL
ncbi:MAG: TonB-dependent receptor [Bacteroidota bacterium]